ncbi:MAG TPA: type II secretion system F family protein [Burkholderiaceae bacterium]|nr:type II secretion system F family protein [Burkholderiaceae bacterium]
MAIETRAAVPIAATAAQAPAPRLARRRGRVRDPVQQRMRFTERLGLQLESGVALHAAIRVLQQQAGDPEFARVLDAIVSEVVEGKPFSQALSRHPQLFPDSYVNLIAASESGGFMHQVLEQLVAMDERQEQLRRTLAGALSYPVMLAAFSVAVVIFVLVVVFPKFGEMFESIRHKLPFSTLVLMGASDVLRQYWLPIVAALGAGAAALVAWLRRPAGRRLLDAAQLRVPGLRDVFVQVYLVRTMRVMSVSLANGVSVIDTLSSCRAVVSNQRFQELLRRVEARVTEGGGIAAAFNDCEFMPALVRQMIETGEQTGNLAAVMGRIADFYERELTRRVTTLSKMAEPVMLLVMGAVVGIIVSALILPIFRLSGGAH